MCCEYGSGRIYQYLLSIRLLQFHIQTRMLLALYHATSTDRASNRRKLNHFLRLSTETGSRLLPRPQGHLSTVRAPCYAKPDRGAWRLARQLRAIYCCVLSSTLLWYRHRTHVPRAIVPQLATAAIVGTSANTKVQRTTTCLDRLVSSPLMRPRIGDATAPAR